MWIDTYDLVALMVVSALLGAYAAWGLTVLWFARRDGNGGGGSWHRDKLNVPDDLSGEEWPEKHDVDR